MLSKGNKLIHLGEYESKLDEYKKICYDLLAYWKER